MITPAGPTFIIHIGPYKTGSSYLQACLQENAERLESAAVHVPSRWNESPLNPSHTGLVQRLNTENKPELQGIIARWRSEGWKTVVISCEDLCRLGPVQVLMLSELTAGLPVSIVYYVRRWPDLLASEWQEYVKQGSTLPFIEVLVHNLCDPDGSRIINIDATLGAFARCFGKRSIRLVSYASVLAEGQDLFEHFARSFLGNPALPKAQGRIVNPSLAPPRAELLRIFNCLDQEGGERHCHRLLRYLELQHCPAPMTRLLTHIGKFAKTLDLAYDLPAVRETLSRNWADYAGCVVGPAGAASFCQPATTRITFISPDYGLAPGFAAAARKLRQDLLALS